MAPNIPGPSSTDRGLPVRNTGSPTVTPADYLLLSYFIILMSFFKKYNT